MTTDRTHPRKDVKEAHAKSVKQFKKFNKLRETEEIERLGIDQISNEKLPTEAKIEMLENLTEPQLGNVGINMVMLEIEVPP